ncbi:MAG: selenocysteine-specific translation elongation factor [Fimbriimonadales bacterium]
MAYLIGSAGHVDHGKTTLIAALTGIEADRLPEEKARGMTIDLGYAFVELEGIGRVSIVDVPGHERFIKNMLAGASGVDVAMLCIAADEGVMPQTREHFQILRLLEARTMVIALTKVDMVDEDGVALAELDAAQLVDGTEFAAAPIVRVSAQTGEGLDALKEALRVAVTSLGERELGATWFLPIDRVFTVEGHGTIITGTLASGKVVDFADAELMPGSHRARIRSVESHGEKSGVAEAGMRTALNVSGVRKDAIHRGQAIGSPGTLFETQCINVRLATVGDLKHSQRVRVHVGTGEFIGRLFLFDHAPGFAQIRLEEPAACARGQRIVIRNYSPPAVLAGAEIMTPNAKQRRKNDPEVAELLREGGEAETITNRVSAALERHPRGISTERVCEALGETAQNLGGVFEEFKSSGKALGFAGMWVLREHVEALAKEVESELQKLHAARPQAAGIPKSQVLAASAIGWPPKPFDRLLAKMADDGTVVLRGSGVALAGHKIALNEKQAALLERVIEKMVAAGATAPSASDLAAAIGAPVQAIDEMIRLGLETGELIRVDEAIYYPPAVLDALRQQLREFGKPFTVAQFRDATGSSRKFALPLLQYFDETRFTRRMGDERIVLG